MNNLAIDQFALSLFEFSMSMALNSKRVKLVTREGVVRCNKLPESQVDVTEMDRRPTQQH
jgi:hypothetical protein